MSFSLEIAGFVNRTIAQQNLLVKRIVLGVDKKLMKKSPVGNPDLWLAKRNGEYVDFLSVHDIPDGYVGGHFRANWQLGVDHIPSGEIEGTDANGLDTLALHISQMPQQAAGKVYYIVNNLPYAQALEDGWSSQSPPGNMVAGTVAEFQGIIAREAASVRR